METALRTGDDRPRVLLVGPLPPPRGGVSVWSELLLASEAARRWRIDVVDTSPRGPVSQEQPLYLQRIVPSALILARVSARVRGAALAHVHANLRWSLARAVLIAEGLRLRGVPAIVHLHGGDVAERLEAWPAPARACLLQALRRCARVVVMTRPAQASLAAHGVRVVHLPNFVDAAALSTPRAPRPGPVRVLFVGAVMPGKGVLELLEALARVPGTVLDVAGPSLDSRAGPGAALVRAAAARLGLGGRVTLHGALPPAAVRDLLRAADVFALPSHREGWPFAVMEAMAAELPVVATRVGALPEMIEDGRTGLLVPPRDVPALAGALGHLAAHPEARLQMGAAAAAWAREHVDVARVLPRLEALWREVAAGGSERRVHAGGAAVLDEGLGDVREAQQQRLVPRAPHHLHADG